MTDNIHTVFVYGTLKRGEGNNGRLRDHRAEFVGNADTIGRFRMWCNGGFPLIKAAKGNTGTPGRVAGEVWRTNDAGLRSLDALEGNGRMYQRRQIQVVTGDGKRVVAWAYEWLRDTDWQRELAPDAAGVITWGGR